MEALSEAERYQNRLLDREILMQALASEMLAGLVSLEEVKEEESE